MKLAEVVPLYKGKEEDMVINYHPVSFLMTISEVLEKMYKRMYSFLTRNNIFFNSMDLDLRDLVNTQSLRW